MQPAASASGRSRAASGRSVHRDDQRDFRWRCAACAAGLLCAGLERRRDAARLARAASRPAATVTPQSAAGRRNLHEYRTASSAGWHDAVPGRPQSWKKWGPYLARAAVGHGARGLQPARQRLGLLPARSRAQPRLSLGRGRHWRASRDCQQRLCLALALWNGRDPILKERLFGLTNGEGNHGEDVKELYYYLDATPTPLLSEDALQVSAGRFPYEQLVEENRRRGIGAAGVRTDRHRRVRRRSLLRRVRRIRAGRAGRHSDARHRRQPRAGAALAASAAAALVSQYLELESTDAASRVLSDVGAAAP